MHSIKLNILLFGHFLSSQLWILVKTPSHQNNNNQILPRWLINTCGFWSPYGLATAVCCSDNYLIFCYSTFCCICYKIFHIPWLGISDRGTEWPWMGLVQLRTLPNKKGEIIYVTHWQHWSFYWSWLDHFCDSVIVICCWLSDRRTQSRALQVT